MAAGTSIVTEKGQVTIPQEIREEKDIRPGSTIVFAVVDGVVTLRTAEEIERMFREVHQAAKELRITPESVDAACREARRRTLERLALARPP